MSKGVNVDIQGNLDGCNVGVNELNQTNIKGGYVGGDNIKGNEVFKINKNKGNIAVNSEKSESSPQEDKLSFVDEALSGKNKSDIEKCKKVLSDLQIVQQSDLFEFEEEELIKEGISRLFVRLLKKQPGKKRKADSEKSEKNDDEPIEKKPKKVKAEPNIVHCDRDYIGGDRMEGETLFKIGNNVGDIHTNKKK